MNRERRLEKHMAALAAATPGERKRIRSRIRQGRRRTLRVHLSREQWSDVEQLLASSEKLGIDLHEDLADWCEQHVERLFGRYHFDVAKTAIVRCWRQFGLKHLVKHVRQQAKSSTFRTGVVRELRRRVHDLCNKQLAWALVTELRQFCSVDFGSELLNIYAVVMPREPLLFGGQAGGGDRSANA